MKDTMTKEERLRTVLKLGVPDRVPVAPLLGYFLCKYSGITAEDLWFDESKRRSAWEKVYHELGELDAIYFDTVSNPVSYSWVLPMKMKWPGRDLPPEEPLQLLEEELMKAEDYKLVTEAGRMPRNILYPYLLTKMFGRARTELPVNMYRLVFIVVRTLLKELLWLRAQRKRWEARGVPFLWTALSEAPFDTMSLIRSIEPFSLDLFRRPEEVSEAAMACVDGFVLVVETTARIIGGKRVWIMLHRSANSYISPRQFKSLAFPSLKAIVTKLAARGYNMVLHCDGNWDLNLENMLELPSRTCMIQFDGATDIFRAKEILRDHSCIYGDVPAQLLVTGTADEVDQYCKKLIEVVGKGGGFCLGSGCELARDARPENVRVMLQSVRKYGYYS